MDKITHILEADRSGSISIETMKNLYDQIRYTKTYETLRIKPSLWNKQNLFIDEYNDMSKKLYDDLMEVFYAQKLFKSYHIENYKDDKKKEFVKYFPFIKISCSIRLTI